MPEYGNLQSKKCLSPEGVITIHNPRNNSSVSVKAIADMGAVMTVIPTKSIEQIGDVKIYGSREFKYADGAIEKKKTYFVDITVDGQRENNVEVVALDKKYGLIGRDILNKHKAVFDAPNERWSLGNCKQDCLNEKDIDLVN